MTVIYHVLYVLNNFMLFCHSGLDPESSMSHWLTKEHENMNLSNAPRSPLNLRGDGGAIINGGIIDDGSKG